MCSVFRRHSGRFKLHEAIQEGDIQCLAEVARSSSHGFDGVNEYDDEGQTALHIAADQGLTEAVAILSTRGADLNVPREEDSRTPLHIAVNEGHVDVVEALLESGAKVNTPDVDGWLPLHVAAYYGAAEIAGMLLSHGAKVNAVTSKGQTALHIAVEMAENTWLNRDADYQLTVKLLLGAGADVNARDGYGQSPIHVAAKNLDLPTMAVLLDHGAAVEEPMEPDGRMPIHIAAARAGQLAQDACELLLARGAGIDAASKDGRTPLLSAVESNCPSMIKWLIGRGADPRRLCGSSGWGAAHLAVRLGLESCLLALLQQDEGLKSLEDSQGFTPLATAAEVGNEEIAQLLIDRGVDVNQQGSPQKRRITALMVATYHKQEAMMQLLLDNGADVNLQDANGHTPLHIASLLNAGHLIPPLLHAKANTSIRDNSGRTAEELAEEKSADEALKQFSVLSM